MDTPEILHEKAGGQFMGDVCIKKNYVHDFYYLLTFL